MQDFTALYASLFFSVLLGILYDKVKKSGAISIRKMQGGLIITVLVLVAQYHLMNYRTDISTDQIAAGEVIKNTASDEVAFWTEEDPSPQLVYYAGRNIRYAKATADAKSFLMQRGLKKGAVFSTKAGNYNVEHISIDSTATH